MKILIFNTAVLVFAAQLSFGAPAKKGATAKATPPPKVVKTYSVATDARFPPFSYETADKKVVGFEPEIIEAIANQAGLQIKIVNSPWPGNFSPIMNDTFDILISSVSVWNPRKKIVDFSKPYFEAIQYILVPKASKVTKLSELKNMKVSFHKDTTAEELVVKLQGAKSPHLKGYENAIMPIKALENKEVDACVIENGSLATYLVYKKGDFKIVRDESIPTESYGIVVKKGNTDLLKKIDDGLAAIKANGVYDRIYAKYFGSLKLK